MRKLKAADLFCGAGGTTEGAERSGAVTCRFALNHWQVAVDTHSANFPHAKHVNSRLDQCSPAECDAIDLLFASPECTHHSRARGGRPTSDQQRSGAWQVLPWVEHHRPSFVVIENVTEFREWGPVGDDGRPLVSKRGKFFDAWLMALQAAGYRVDHRELNAADYGAATSRNRLFVMARKGNRQPTWPEPTHCRKSGGELPGFDLPRWRAAAEVIDWTVPIHSIFARKRALADNTLLRLEAGLRRFVGPAIVQFNEGIDRRSKSINEPLSTVTAGGKRVGLAIPHVIKFSGQESAEALPSPLSVIRAGGNHHGLAVPFQYQLIGNGAGRSRDAGEPIPTIIATRGNHGLAVPWISHYYGTDNQSPVDEPIDTMTTKPRHSLAVAVCRGPADWPAPATDAMRTLQATMRELGVADLLFRMLQNHELSAAQGFRPEYIFTGTKADVTRQIGNSVSPPVATAICQSIAG